MWYRVKKYTFSLDAAAKKCYYAFLPMGMGRLTECMFLLCALLAAQLIVAAELTGEW